VQIVSGVARDASLGQEHVHVAGHPARNRVDGEANITAALFHQVGQFSDLVLGLRHRQAATRHDDRPVGVDYVIRFIDGAQFFSFIFPMYRNGISWLS
jgi:hypothetical protein